MKRVLGISLLLFLVGLMRQTPAVGVGRSIEPEMEKGGHSLVDPRGNTKKELISEHAKLSSAVNKARNKVRSLTNELPAAGDDFRRNVESLFRDPVLRSGVTAVYVVDAHTGKPILEHNVDKLLNPASNVKLIATAAALDAFGPDWRYETFFGGDRKGKSGIRDLYLEGSGDPTLEAGDLENMVKELAEAGIKRIHGDLFLSPGALLARGDNLKLDLVVFGRPSRRFSRGELDEGESAEGRAPVAQALVSGMPSYLSFESRVGIKAGTEGDVKTKLELESDNPEENGFLGKIVVSGTIRSGAMVRFSPEIDNSYVRTAEVLLEVLESNGIELAGNIRLGGRSFPVFGDGSQDRQKLSVHRSMTMAELAAIINKSSDNYLADSLTATLGAYVYGGRSCMNKGVAAMKRWLVWRTGIDTRDIVLDTGSGLSYKTRISARQIMRVLRVAGGYRMPTACPPRVSGGRSFWVCDNSGKISSLFKESLAVAHRDGTLRRRMTYLDLNSRLIGKTGTLRGISALSGFMFNGEGNRLAFSIVTNGADRFEHSTIRRRHGWFVGHLDDYMVSSRNLLENLGEARERLSAALRDLQRSAAALVADQVQNHDKLFSVQVSPDPDSVVRSDDPAFSKNPQTKRVYIAGLNSGNMVFAGEGSDRSGFISLEEMAVKGGSYAAAVSFVAAWKAGGIGIGLPGTFWLP